MTGSTLTLPQPDDRYSLGIKRIDCQPHAFLEIINWLSDRLRSCDDAGLRHRYIEEVIRYALFHFFSEENLMLEIDYPDREQHRQLHQKLVNELNHIVSRMDMGEIDYDALIDFLGNWFFKHTLEEDTRIAQLMKTL
ncbi:bacteriohemerythrin [Desulfococcus multivorans]|uniref:Hemerythrin-like metal-binding protein n=1 Tax=Desulfococcus multivorans DSM 2059 TaxID=1121405 RepID=S7TWC0_DESML|nr:hemerythrin domain-containing protein [Desulfococcus multivorans]AOY60445.1 bacteriaohemerythrin [Desulfococcus multivorans]AQV02538.1 hypothetical protein B2D07_18360 [Desulfococcus multivorans]EPR41070.1 hemerythrin-like metal-binding protein [Desulfococcus multivorans DSM 2059]SJZ61725.1 hemerythrin [Desulfococcus multivorans DSM 2059]